jgi:DegV family protein with EDD domain
MTDTNSGISVQEGQEMGVYVLPMPVVVDGKEYTEGVDITHEALFEALEDGKPAMTSQPSPADVRALWDKALADGAEQVVYIPMSSKLSGSCDAAAALAEEYGGKVAVVDNHRISVTMRQSVVQACRLAGEGKSAEEIKKKLEEAGASVELK